MNNLFRKTADQVPDDVDAPQPEGASLAGDSDLRSQVQELLPFLLAGATGGGLLGAAGSWLSSEKAVTPAARRRRRNRILRNALYGAGAGATAGGALGLMGQQFESDEDDTDEPEEPRRRTPGLTRLIGNLVSGVGGGDSVNRGLPSMASTLLDKTYEYAPWATGASLYGGHRLQNWSLGRAYENAGKKITDLSATTYDAANPHHAPAITEQDRKINEQRRIQEATAPKNRGRFGEYTGRLQASGGPVNWTRNAVRVGRQPANIVGATTIGAGLLDAAGVNVPWGPTYGAPLGLVAGTAAGAPVGGYGQYKAFVHNVNRGRPNPPRNFRSIPGIAGALFGDTLWRMSGFDKE